MSQVFTFDQIKAVVAPASLIASQEEGFVAYSEGRVVVPPVGHLGFVEPPGDCHIKYGYIKGDDRFVVKIATGFYENPELGLPVGNGMMAIFSQKTGMLEALLLDEGYLTDLRTAIAGAICAKYLAPKHVSKIGIIGTGVQARMQLEILKTVTECRQAVVWGRDEAKGQQFRSEMSASGFSIETVREIEDLTAHCNLIVTTTPAREPLLYARDIRPGTHITAVGADAEGKQELDPEIFVMTDLKIVDSVSQCTDHGDTSYAVKSGLISKSNLVELGAVIKNPTFGRTRDDQITVADLTGLAVQDIQIAKFVHQRLSPRQATATKIG